MATRIKITRGDLLKRTIVKAGWYPCRVAEITEKAAKTDGSTNVLVAFEIIGGEFKGVPLRHNFNEKWSIVDRYASAFGINVSQKVEESGGEWEFEFKPSLNRTLMVYTKPGKDDQGRDINSVEDFRPMEAVAAAPEPPKAEPPKAAEVKA